MPLLRHAMSSLFAHCWWWYPETKIHYFSIRIPPSAAHFRSCFSPRVPACPDFAVSQALPVSCPFISDSLPIHVPSASSLFASLPSSSFFPNSVSSALSPARHRLRHTPTDRITIRRTVSKTLVFVCSVVFLITFVVTGTEVPGRYLVKNLGNFSPRVTGTALLLRLTPWHGKCCGGTGLVAML